MLQEPALPWSVLSPSGHCRHPPFPPTEGVMAPWGALGVSPTVGTPWDALRGHWHGRWGEELTAGVAPV